MRGLRERTTVVWDGRESGFEAGTGGIGFYSGAKASFRTSGLAVPGGR